MKKHNHNVIDHKVEITQANGKFYVFIDGLPLKSESESESESGFSSSQAAYDAAERVLARQRKVA